jgi:hypothetical protein
MGDWTKRLAWLRPGNPENPFLVEVLDCRIASAELSRSIGRETNSDAAASLANLAEVLQGEYGSPSGVTSSCSIIVRSTRERLEALQSLSIGTDDRWRLVARDDRIFVRRRWTGQTVHVAEFELDDESLLVKRVTSDPGFTHNSPQYAVAEMEFLLASYLVGQRAAFPIPPHLTHKDVAKIALSGWKTHGPLAAFARFL